VSLLPHQFKAFKALIEKLRSDLVSLLETIQKSSTAIANQQVADSKSQEDEREKIVHAIDNLANQKDKGDNAAEAKHERRHGQNLVVQWVLASVTFLAFVAAGIYALEAHKQLSVMHDTYGEIQKQTTAAQEAADTAREASLLEIAAFAQNQFQDAQTLRQMQTQSRAAQSGASTAKDALQISERAYLAFGNPTFQSKIPVVISLPIVNPGHIDATGALTTIIEETVSLTDHKKLEGHWSRLRSGNIPPTGSGIETNVTTDAPQIDTAAIGAGKQRVFILGTVTYNDGFADMEDQNAPFCYEGVPTFDGKDVRFIFCDASTMIPIVEKEINYPENYETPSLYQ
jgi:hypothetical protein